MSLLWIDGFETVSSTVDAYINSTVLGKRYASVSYGGYIYLRSGRTGGYGIEPAYAYAVSFTTYTFSAANDTYYVGFGIRPHSSIGNGTIDLVLFRKGGNSGITIRYTYPTKELLVLNRSGVQIASTARANLAPGTWNYVEIKVKDAVAGAVTILVNGYEVLVKTGIDTTASSGVGYDSAIFTIGSNSNYGIRIDDLYIANGAGSVNNGFLGNAQIRGIMPNADTATKDWGRSAGSDNYALVDDIPSNDDTDYTTADGTASDLFGYADASDLGTIAGIQVNSTMKEMATAVVPTIKNLVASGGTTYEQTTQAITTSYKTLYSIVETDPYTTLAWTLTNLNAAQFGVKRA